MPVGRKRRRRLSGVNIDATNIATPARDGSVPPQFLDLGSNDDEAERRKERRLSLARRKSTPRRASRSGVSSPYVGSRRAALGQEFQHIDLTNGQLADIYSKTIQLAQHGKITQKNTWELQLVDYINDVLKLDQQTNFQKASHTLDAASKIYGSRVDSVHKHTYKVLTSFHQSDQTGDARLNIEEEIKKRRDQRSSRNRNVGKATLVGKEEQINETLKNLSVQVDPLFHKTASAFDEGGAKGLLMNQLYMQNGCEMVFDSNTVLATTDVSEDSESDEEIAEKEKSWIVRLKQVSFGTNPTLEESEADLVESLEGNIDLTWIEKSEICPLLKIFDKRIETIAKGLPPEAFSRAFDESKTEISRDPERLNFEYGDDYHSDDDVMLNFPTAGNLENNAPFDQINVNAAQVFDDDFDGHLDVHDFGGADYAAPNDPPLLDTDVHMNDVQPANPNNTTALGRVDGTINYAAIAGDAVKPVTIQPKNAEMQFKIDTSAALASMAQQRPNIQKTINLNAMNELIEQLEQADMENMTTFFDPKKHGNWAGPDQWYHRRYQLTMQRQQQMKHKRATARRQSASVSVAYEDGDADYVPKEDKAKRGRGKKRFKGIDFKLIAQGEFIEDEAFQEPKRSNNAYSDKYLANLQKNTHRLPKDLQIKPNVFIKMYSKPTYSVWNHWLKTYQARAKVAYETDTNTREVISKINEVAHHPNIDPRQQIDLIQSACNAAIAGADEDEEIPPDFYNYANRHDSDNFVPEMSPLQPHNDNDGPIDLYTGWENNDFQLVDAPEAVGQVNIEFATKPKKVDVRSLKRCLWDQINEAGDDETENLNPNVENNTDVEMTDRSHSVSKSPSKHRSFQKSMTMLQDKIEGKQLQNVSTQFCFICLLHLANEKNLHLEANEEDMFGDFSILMQDEQEHLSEELGQQIMILGQG